MHRPNVRHNLCGETSHRFETVAIIVTNDGLLPCPRNPFRGGHVSTPGQVPTTPRKRKQTLLLHTLLPHARVSAVSRLYSSVLTTAPDRGCQRSSFEGWKRLPCTSATDRPCPPPPPGTPRSAALRTPIAARVPVAEPPALPDRVCVCVSGHASNTRLQALCSHQA